MAAYLNANSTRMQGFNYFDHAQGGGGTGYFMDNDTSACEGLLSAVQSWAGY
jgi:hypothetical protein